MRTSWKIISFEIGQDWHTEYEFLEKLELALYDARVGRYANHELYHNVLIVNQGKE